MRILSKFNIKLLTFTILFLSKIFLFSVTYAVSNTYVGAELIYAKMQFKENFGENIFPKKFMPGINFLVGHMYNQYVGIEAGYEIQQKAHREVNLDPNAIIMGVQMPNLRYGTKTWVEQRHPYLGVVGKLYFLQANSLSLMLGLAYSRLKEFFHLYESNPGVALPAAQQQIKTFAKNKFIPIAKLSLEHKFYNAFTVRLSASWKNTAAFDLTSTPSQTKATNSYAVGLGILYYL